MEGQHIIAMGVPMWICYDNDECATLWGFWSFVLSCEYIPFSGVLYFFRGSYLRALWNYCFDYKALGMKVVHGSKAALWLGDRKDNGYY
jgi:hypothetical protein